MAADVRTLNIGIAGLGLAGSGMVAPAVAAMPGVYLAAACDTNPRALETFGAKYEARTFAAFEELSRDPDIDAIWVATPNLLHGQHAIEAMRHGKHVIVEKPMALNLDEAQSMLEAARQNDVQLICGGSRSSSAVVRKMRELVVSGELGPLRALTTWAATDWMLRPRRPDEYDVTKGGGVAFRQAPHQVDSVRLLAGGRVCSVRGITGAWMKPRDTAPGHYSALLEFENGAYATLIYSAYGYFMASELFDAGPAGTTAPGTQSRIDARREITSGGRDEGAAKEQLAASRGGASSGPRSPYLSDLGLLLLSCERGEVRQSPRGLYVYREDRTDEIVLTAPELVGVPELVELQDAIFSRKQALHDCAWGMATLEVCLAIMQSSAEHRDISLLHQVAVPDSY